MAEQNFLCDVVEAGWLGENMRSLTFYAPELLQTPIQNSDPISCWFPDPADGFDEFMRSYTVTEIDREKQTFVLHFLLHNNPGPAALWAKDSQVGDDLFVSYYESIGFRMPEPHPNGVLFIADAAGVPFVNSAADHLSGVPARAILLKHHETDQRLPTAVEAVWVPPAELAYALSAQHWEGWHAEIVCEASAAQSARKWLTSRGLAKGSIRLHAYWTIAGAMGSKR